MKEKPLRCCQCTPRICTIVILLLVVLGFAIFSLVFFVSSIVFFSLSDVRQPRINSFNSHVKNWNNGYHQNMVDIKNFNNFSSNFGPFKAECDKINWAKFRKDEDSPDINTLFSYNKSCYSLTTTLGPKSFNPDVQAESIQIMRNGKVEVEIGVKLFDSYYHYQQRGGAYVCYRLGGKRNSYLSLNSDWSVIFNIFLKIISVFHKYLRRVCVTFNPKEDRFEKVDITDSNDPGGCFRTGDIGLYGITTGNKDSESWNDYSLSIEIRSVHDPEVLYFRENGVFYDNEIEIMNGFGESGKKNDRTGIGLLLTSFVFPIIVIAGIIVAIIIAYYEWRMKKRDKGLVLPRKGSQKSLLEKKDFDDYYENCYQKFFMFLYKVNSCCKQACLRFKDGIANKKTQTDDDEVVQNEETVEHELLERKDSWRKFDLSLEEDSKEVTHQNLYKSDDSGEEIIEIEVINVDDENKSEMEKKGVGYPATVNGDSRTLKIENDDLVVSDVSDGKQLKRLDFSEIKDFSVVEKKLLFLIGDEKFEIVPSGDNAQIFVKSFQEKLEEFSEESEEEK